MPTALASKLDRLEAEISPPRNDMLKVSFVWNDDEWQTLRKEQAATIVKESSMVLLSIED